MPEPDELVDKKEVIKQFNAVEVIPPGEWANLVDDCKAILIESVTNVRQTVIECKWGLGDLLVNCGDERVTPHLEKLGEEINCSDRELFRCLSFRKKFESLDDMWSSLPEGKNISWHKLCHDYIGFDMALPRPKPRVDQVQDTFGLIPWWTAQKGINVVHVTDPKTGVTLAVSRVLNSEAEKAVISKPVDMQYRQICDAFIKYKKWNADDLGRDDWNRMHRAVALLLAKAKFDTDKVLQALKWCNDNYSGSKIDWTLDTVVKKYAEACRPVKSWEKHLKKNQPRGTYHDRY